MSVSLELVMELRVEIAEPIEIGDVKNGFRKVIPITGGTVEGDKLRGIVVPGGADWNLKHVDGTSEIWARYTIMTEDGVPIMVTNSGFIHEEQVSQQGVSARYGRTVPSFEVSGDKYAWLNKRIFVGTLQPVPEGGEAEVRKPFPDLCFLTSPVWVCFLQ